jgi:hypothetical protein
MAVRFVKYFISGMTMALVAIIFAEAFVRAF